MICFPNAKINIGLYVTGRRADGYHTIETIYYPVPLRDALEVVKSENTSLTQTGFLLGIAPEDNLVMKAFNLMHQHYKLPPLAVFLKKFIPSGAGLGGGSADAAFMLLLLREWRKKTVKKSDVTGIDMTESSVKESDVTGIVITESELLKMAESLGADCPFFIRNTPVIATGTGNLFQPTDLSLKGYLIFIVKPPVSISTKEAYSMVKPRQPAFSLDKLSDTPVCEWKHFVKNDFEAGIFRKYPVIEKIKAQLYEMGAVYASMTGSGSAVFGLFSPTASAATSDCSTKTASAAISNALFPDCFIWKGILE